jgi:hypothetical protein
VEDVQKFGEDTIQDLLDEVGFCVRNLTHPSLSLDAAGRFYEILSDSRRALAILRLLAHGDIHGFHCELIRSAKARRRYLALCARESYTDFHYACSRSEPFFDALAAGAFDLARDIAALSPKEWREGDEYEDDYCYARFLYDFSGGAGALPGGADGLLEKFNAALLGAPAGRFKMCKVLNARDFDAFDGAFSDLLDERIAEVESDQAGLAQEDPCLAIGTYVYIEGLALLNLADQAGFKTRREYPLCPALARAPFRGAFPADDLPPL